MSLITTSFTLKMNTKKLILISTFIYVNISLFLFYQTWVSSPYSFFTSMIFVGFTIFQIKKINIEHIAVVGKRDLILLSVLSLVLILASGVSGLGGIPAFDINHQLQKVVDAGHLKWPIYYREPASYASYYYGFYLIPGLIYSIIGNVKLVMLVWETLGTFLGLYWIFLFLNSNILKTVLVFSHSGLLSILAPLVKQESLIFSRYFYFSDVPWSLLPNYLSLRWVPNQFAFCLIIVGMFLYFRNTKNILYLSTLFISGFFLAPFVSFFVGIIYLSKLAIIFREKLSNQKKEVLSFLIVNGFLVIFLLFYLISNKTSQSFEFQLNTTERIRNYLLLILIEVLILYSFIYKKYRKLMEVRIALVILFLIPLYKLGHYNDFYARGNLPMILILFLFFLKSLKFDISYKNLCRLTFIVLMSITPVKYFFYAMSGFSLNTTFKESENVHTLLMKDFQSKDIADQYLMNSNSIFYKYLLNKPTIESNSKHLNEKYNLPQE